MAQRRAEGIVFDYVQLGHEIGRHIDGFVDAYYGPPEIARRAALSPMPPPAALVDRARRLLSAIDAGEPLGTLSGEEEEGSPEELSARRRYLRAQSLGLLTTARRLSGDPVSYVEEVESCYGVRPERPSEETFLSARRDLEEAVPGSGPLDERLIAWRESHAVPPDRLEAAVQSLAADLRARTESLFGLPEGESVEFVFVENEPWSGFNFYLGELRSRVAINLDLPVLSTSLAHLVAHESYPGHHTEHSRKEVGLVRRRHFDEESIFLVGTPQCLLSEGLADLGLEIVVGERPERFVEDHLRPLKIAYEPDVVAVVTKASEALGKVRAFAAFRLHEDGADADVVIDEVARFAILPRGRAEKAVAFLLDPTWRAYISCYVEGLPRCRAFAKGRPERFERLLSDQLTPADLSS